MLGILHVAPSEAWSGTVPNGMSCMVTHISENAQNGMMISATDKETNLQHQPPQSTYELAKPCEKSDQSKNNDINVKKNILVENLVDTTVLIIDVIWYQFPVHLNSQVIPLRLFVQETLRRSRTSWSTLQTALFYLMKIRSQIKFICLDPDRWTLKSKDDNNQGSDPATCGRRMFLASLIISSKYLQDRNYANNAWSKICGLPVQEINAIERRFLKLIDYNLFIGEDTYKRWTNSLRSHIQATKGSEVTSENRKAQIFRTLQQPQQAQAVECKVQG